MIDKQKLREIASNATPGDWYSADEACCERHEDDNFRHGCSMIDPDDDAAFIAAASPATVLALLDEIECLMGNPINRKRYRCLGCDMPVVRYEDMEEFQHGACGGLVVDVEEAIRLLEKSKTEAARLHDTLKAVVDVCIDKGKLRAVECVAEDAPPRAVAKIVEQRDAAIARAEDAEASASALRSIVSVIEPRVVEAIAAWAAGVADRVRIAGKQHEAKVVDVIVDGIRNGEWRKP